MKRQKRIRTHDGLCAIVGRELAERGWDVDFFLEYRRDDGRLLGEIDIYATKGDYSLFVEAKKTDSSKSRRRAKKQLRRAYSHHEQDHERLFCLYTSQNKEGIVYHLLLGGQDYGKR